MYGSALTGLRVIVAEAILVPSELCTGVNISKKANNEAMALQNLIPTPRVGVVAMDDSSLYSGPAVVQMRERQPWEARSSGQYMERCKDLRFK